jgi:hypothetical protein
MRRLVCLIALMTVEMTVAQFAGAQPKPAAPAAAPATQPTTRPAATRPLPPGQLLDSLLKPPSAVGQPLQPIQEGPVMDKTSGAGAVAPGAPQLNLMREGSYVVDRTGRLTRNADGSGAELTFDADGKALRDPPMVILPNLKLVQMENAVAGSARDVRFKVTGMVTEYKGRNYILLEKVVVVPDVTQQF